MKILVTGARGFVGSYLIDFLTARRGVQIHGIVRPGKDYTSGDVSKKVAYHQLDMCKAKDLERVIRKIRPDRIFHLAAQSFTPLSWEKPSETLMNNIMAELNVLEILRRFKIPSRVQIAGSAEVYGKVEAHEIPIKETNPLRPLSPYGVSKVAQELLGCQYYQNFKIHVVVTRAFSHIGPGQSGIFVAGDFAKQIALIEVRKRAPEIRVGNLESIRDFTDVRDVTRAYWLALEKGRPGEIYNICSGAGHSVREILEIYLRESKVKIKIKQDRSRMRPSDIPILRGDNSKFFAQTEWKPSIPFKDTLKDILNYWRQNINA